MVRKNVKEEQKIMVQRETLFVDVERLIFHTQLYIHT